MGISEILIPLIGPSVIALGLILAWRAVSLWSEERRRSREADEWFAECDRKGLDAFPLFTITDTTITVTTPETGEVQIYPPPENRTVH